MMRFAAVLLLIGTGCSQHGTTEKESAATIRANPTSGVIEEVSPFLLTRSDSSNLSSPEAMIKGRFRIVDDCLVYELVGNLTAFTPSLPHGTQLLEDGLGLRINDHEIAFGQNIEFSGGTLAREVVMAEIPSTCPDQIVFIGGFE